MNAFLTGSHAYGTPHKQSDIDLAILVDRETRLAPARLGQMETNAEYPARSTPLRFGDLNLLVFECPITFEAWRMGTAVLKCEALVAREAAVALIKRLQQVAK